MRRANLRPSSSYSRHVHELEELDREIAHRHLDLPSEVDELRVHSAADRAPLILLDEARRVAAKALIARAQHQQLRADRLGERRDAEGLLDARRRVADAE